MYSKVGRKLTEAELIQSIEAANRLHILYSFEDNVGFTDVFLDTIKIINEDDIFWKEYIRILDVGVNLIPDSEVADHLIMLTATLLTIHTLRLKIPFIEEDHVMAIDLTRAAFEVIMRKKYFNEDFSEEAMRKWTRNRHDWLPLELSLDKFKR